MRYIEAPDEFDGVGRSLFLAGGISGTSNWQAVLTQLLSGTDLVILNPRRRSFPMDDPDAAREQITWEYRHLRKAWGQAFWFPPPTLCPIALYELGASSSTSVPLFVGCDPEYARRDDVEIQLSLARPDLRVVGSLHQLAEQIVACFQSSTEWAKNEV